MNRTRWKLLIGTLGLSLGGLAAVAVQYGVSQAMFGEAGIALVIFSPEDPLLSLGS